MKITKRFFHWCRSTLLGRIVSSAFIIFVIAIFSLSAWHFATRPKDIQNDLQKFATAGEQVKNDFGSIPSVALAKTDEGFEFKDDLKEEGIKIENKSGSADGLEIQNNSPENPEPPKEELAIKFPKNYAEPMEINLPQKGQILITDNSKEKFSSQILTNQVSESSTFGSVPKVELSEQKAQENYLKYSSGRKSIYYAYQKDQAQGERQLKNWLIYSKGNGKEQESYTFQNARLELDQQGQVKVFFDNGQEQKNQQAMADVEPSLLERARKAIEKDTGEDITQEKNQKPDFTIPQAYYIGKGGERKTVDWKIEDDNTLKLDFSVPADQYPIALDPTLQFTAPGTSNSAGVITGEAGTGQFGVSSVAGDFNADGKTDLAVGAYMQSHAYIFYNDGSIPTTAATADVIIDGEASSNFGATLAAGDFNNDGKTDLAVGAKGYNSSQGRAYIFWNDGTGADFGTVVCTTDCLAANADAIITGEAGTGQFGYSLATGDWNNDGKTDLVVGASAYNSGQGSVYLFFQNNFPASAATADVIITGEAGSSFGSSLAAGDFNADGKTDLAVGATSYTTNTGRAYLFYNDGSIPTTATTADTIITGETTSNYFGASLAAGDFNSDGKIDLAIGAYGYTTNTGRAYLFWNDGTGSDFGTVACTTDCLAANADTIITGETTSNYFGASLAAGDFNNDGKIDLAIGAYGYTTNTGRAYLFYNDGSIPTTAATADAIITGETTSNYFGASLAAGDFNADGKTDLAAGAYGYNSNQGRTYIFYSQNGVLNTNSGIPGETAGYFGCAFATGDLNNDGTTDLAVGAYLYYGQGRVYIFYQSNFPASAASADAIIEGEASGSQFGYALATGDLDNNGTIDLAVGSPIGISNTGHAYIFYNDGSYPASASSADVNITGMSAPFGRFGHSLATGDLNADGKTDLVVGMPGGLLQGKRVFIFYNDGSYTSTASSADVIIVGATSSYFGVSLAAGDFNNDGTADLAVSATKNPTQGKVYIFYNDGSIPTTAATADVIITGENTDDFFGTSLISGDFNNDAKTDLAVGANGYNSSQGRVYIFYNDGSIPTTAATADVIITGENVGDYFGTSLISGDFNNDAKTDLAVGANGYNSSQGRVYIFYNDGSIPTTAATADVIITGEADSNFGYSLAAGDLNNDGTNDLIAGATQYSFNQGRAYIFLNDGSYPSSAGSADTQIAGKGESSSFSGASSSFGVSLAAGDFNADGHTDLAVGAYYYNSGQGRAYIFWNDGSIPTTAATADLTLTGEVGSYFGYSLATGDLNADGRADLAVGAYGYNSSQGRAYIFLNDGSIPTTAATADVIITGEANSYFGSALGTGDFNADGKTDLAVGAYMQSHAYIFLNDGTYPATAATADTIITGEAGSRFGYSLAAGDFNADGHTDLAVGAYYYNSGQGRAYIFWNDGSIPTTAATADLTLTGEVGSYFGYSLATGDLNADGRADLAVGAYGYNSSQGRAYIFLNDGSIPTSAGSADTIITGEVGQGYFGISLATGDLNADGRVDLAVAAYYYNSSQGRAYIFLNDGSIPTSAGSADTIITGEGTGNYFGSSLATGDLNADGRVDLAVAAYGYNSSQGRTYIFLNDGSIPTSAGSADTIITGEASSVFGFSLATGDLNNDGRTDLAVGAYLYNSSQGKIYFYDGQEKYSTTLQRQSDSVRVSGAAGEELKITGVPSSQFGYAMTTGDFDNDGKTDLAVGALGYNSNTGRVYIFYNDGSIPISAFSPDLVITGEGNENYFGRSLASGDLNGDGKTDLAVGADKYNSYQGRVYIFLNDGSIPTSAGSADSIITGEGTNNAFGRSLASGDLNADGKTDLAVGAYAYDNSYQGRAYIFLNDGSYPSAAGSANTIITGEGTNNYFGCSLSAGDLDGDGDTDLAVSAYRYNSFQGRVYIFLNDGSYPSAAGSADSIITGENDFDYFGTSLATGDLNADGRTDLAVGAFGYNSYQGRAYIFWNDGTGADFGTVACTTDCLAANADAIITGEGIENYFGDSLSTGDLNGDGKTDLVVGAYGYNNYQGRAYIFLNDGSIPSAAGSADTIITGEGTHNFFSTSLGTGDFNSDGKTDLAVGANGYNSSQGRTYIYTFNDTVSTGETGSALGSSLAAGDFNADGTVDLAVGAPNYNSNQGRVYLFWNKSGALQTSAASADKIITGEIAGDYFGWSLAAGNVVTELAWSGETIDLIASAKGYNSSQGRVYIFQNDGDYPATAATADTIITGETGSAFGTALSAGNLNNTNSKTDLAVGAPAYNSSQGRAYIFLNDGTYPATAATADTIITGETGSGFGNAMVVGNFHNTGSKTDLAIGASIYNSNQGRAYIFLNDGSIPTTAATADTTITGETTGDYFGISLATGDFNSDGWADLAVGASGYSSSAGRAYIFLNDGTIPTTAGTADTTITGEASSKFGWSLATGDLNADGRADLAVGAYNYNSSQGRAYTFYNDDAYPTLASASEFASTGESAGDNYGNSLATGDFNTDGKIDLAIGASGASSGAGKFYVIISEASAPTQAELQQMQTKLKARGTVKFKGNVQVR